MFRVIREFRPTWVIAENVGGLLTIEQGMVFEQVCVDLETEGYEVQTFIIPACAVNAPHRRDRVWFIAHADKNKCNRTERRCVNEEKRKEGKVGEKDNPAGEFAGTDSKLYADRKSDGYVTNPNNRGQKIQEQQAAGDQQCDRRFAADAVCPNSRGKNNDGLQNKRRRFCSNRGAGIQSKDREACADNIKQGDGIIADAGSAVCDGRGKITTTGDKDRVLSSKQSRKQTRCSASRCDDATVGKEQVDRDPDLIGLQGGGEERYCSEQNKLIETPTSLDYKGAGKNDTVRNRLDYTVEKTTDGMRTGLKLHPHFALWMMGFPISWLDFPMEEKSVMASGERKL